MKKKLAGLLAALMVLSMSTTVFAATSPTAEDLANNSTVKAGDTYLQKTAMDDALLEETKTEAKKITGNAEIMAAFDVAAPTNASYPLKLTIAVPNVSEGDSIAVLHKKSNGSWEQVRIESVSNGYVTIEVDSLSPIAVIRTATAAQNGSNGNGNANGTQPVENNYYNYYTNPSATSGSTSSNANNSGITQTNNNNQVVNVYTTAPAAAAPGASTSNTSPKTGASVPVLPIIAVLSIMGIAVCSKKALSL